MLCTTSSLFCMEEVDEVCIYQDVERWAKLVVVLEKQV